MNKDLNIALIPLLITWENIEANIAELKSKVAQVHPDTDLIILPETFATGFPTGKKQEDIITLISDKQQGIIATLRNLAASKNMAICGTLILNTDGVLTNSAFFMEPNGDFSTMPKRHLFSMAGENKIFSRGNGKLKVRYRGWNIMMAVCYDIRFPVWTRNVKNEYDLLVYSANWPSVRVSAWNALLPARAIENEAYVCGVNCIGTDSAGFDYDGASHLYDFKGKEIAKPTESGILYASLSKQNLDKFREKFPAWMDADEFNL